jgi:8-oxo-dGTP pyrophosphatase MutT (NUDIX family)
MSVISSIFDDSSRSLVRAKGRVHRVRCVLVHEERYLLAQHNSRRPENFGKWGLVGGRVRAAEQPKACLRRELMEELRYEVPNLVKLGDYSHRDENHRVFGCEIPEAVQTFDTDELRAIRWFSYAEVCDLATSGQLRTGFELAAIAEFRQLAIGSS